MKFEENLKKNKIELPKAADPVGSYVATKEVGKLLYISGQISMEASGNLIKGKLGKDLTTEEGYEAAVRCALSIISQAKKHLSNDLSKIKRIIVTAITGVAKICMRAVAYNDQINKGILNQVIPGALILCTVTIKFIPVNIEENPRTNTANVIAITAVSVDLLYGV